MEYHDERKVETFIELNRKTKFSFGFLQKRLFL